LGDAQTVFLFLGAIMETPASVRKHPIHPMLVGIPIGLWVFSFVCDLIALGLQDQTASVVAFYAMVGGVVGALCAAVPGIIDFMSLKENTKAKRIALWHMGINIAVITMFAVNIGMRVPDIATPPHFAIGLSGIAIALLAVSGWLGGELVHILGISVVEPAGRPETPEQVNGERAVGGKKRPVG
jgi:uncharacterized membrane protein